MQTYLPKLTLVAEIDDPVAFGKGLDTMIIAINNELEARASNWRQRNAKRQPRKTEPTAPPPAAVRGGGPGKEASEPRRAASWLLGSIQYLVRVGRSF